MKANDKATATWILKAYKELKRVYLKEEDRKIFERILEARYKGKHLHGVRLKDLGSIRVVFAEPLAAEDIEKFTSMILMWEKPPRDFSDPNAVKELTREVTLGSGTFEKERRMIKDLYGEIIEKGGDPH